MDDRGKVLTCVLVVLFFCAALYFLTGFFVIQPVGAVPNGVTVWYLRIDTKLPFISSVDGILLDSGAGVSLFGRALGFGAIGRIVIDRAILKLPYSETLYLISTSGRTVDR